LAFLRGGEGLGRTTFAPIFLPFSILDREADLTIQVAAIMGPTASGKAELALAAARATGGLLV
jgi:hypothetical protein